MPKTLSYGSPVVLVASGARATSSNSGNLKNTVNAIPVGDAVSLIVDVSAFTTDATPRLDVYIDISYDNGTTWPPGSL